MNRGSVKDYVEAVRGRYKRVDKKGKGRILDEFVQVTGYHRKSAVRLLRGEERPARQERRGRPRRYGPEVGVALKRVWEASDRLCSKRLGPFMEELVRVLEAHGELALAPQVKRELCALSDSTIDRLLRPYKGEGGRKPLCTTRPGSLLKGAIPIRTFSEWEDAKPGFLEMDLVAHCGESTEGFYLNTLSAVDVATGWIECHAVWGKGQERVGGAIDRLSRTLPFPLLGLDTDNGGEFINQGLFDYCQRHHITFTRSRPYKKNDSAHVEQKNWCVVRRLVGYDRYASHKALDTLGELYTLLRLYMNFFQPVRKLLRKSRHGAKVHKLYDTARTPYQRLSEAGVLGADRREALARLYPTLNPVALLAQINHTLQALWLLAEPKQHTHPSVTSSSDATYPAR